MGYLTIRQKLFLLWLMFSSRDYWIGLYVTTMILSMLLVLLYAYFGWGWIAYLVEV